MQRRSTVGDLNPICQNYFNQPFSWLPSRLDLSTVNPIFKFAFDLLERFLSFRGVVDTWGPTLSWCTMSTVCLSSLLNYTHPHSTISITFFTILGLITSHSSIKSVLLFFNLNYKIIYYFNVIFLFTTLNLLSFFKKKFTTSRW